MVYRTVGLGTTIWSPLASGLLSGKYNEGIPSDSRLAIPGFEWLRDRCLKDDAVGKVKQLADLAKELGTSTAVLSIAWCIRNPNVTTAILGATKAEQLSENLKAIELMSLLTPEVLDRIESIMQNKPVLPEY